MREINYLQVGKWSHCLRCHREILRDELLKHVDEECPHKDEEIVMCARAKGERCDMAYQELLKTAPPHEAPEFIDFLRANNMVVYEDQAIIMIENFKYHTEERPWYTAFSKEEDPQEVMAMTLFNALIPYWDWTWLKKPSEEQSIKRFHIHIHK